MNTPYWKNLRVLGPAVMGVVVLLAIPVTAQVHSTGKANTTAEPSSDYPPKINLLEIPGKSSVQEAVALVQSNLPEGQEPLNVLFDERAASLRVPALTLRNVTGADALMLIATAADAELRPIPGVDTRNLGYKFRAPQKAPVALIPQNDLRPVIGRRSEYGSRGFSSGGQTRTSGVGDRSEDAGESGDSQAGYTTTSKEVVVTYGDSGGGGFGNRYGGGGQAARLDAGPAGGQVSSQITEIYPLANIIATYDFTVVEKTLLPLLEMEGIKGDSALLAFHDETQVLVARGPVKLHDLIHTLLSALRNNVEERKQADANQQLENLKQQIQKFTLEREHLLNRLDRAEALAQKYAEELKAIKR